MYATRKPASGMPTLVYDLKITIRLWLVVKTRRSFIFLSRRGRLFPTVRFYSNPTIVTAVSYALTVTIYVYVYYNACIIRSRYSDIYSFLDRNDRVLIIRRLVSKRIVLT